MIGQAVVKPVAIRTRKRWGVAGRSQEIVGEIRVANRQFGAEVHHRTVNGGPNPSLSLCRGPATHVQPPSRQHGLAVAKLPPLAMLSQPQHRRPPETTENSLSNTAMIEGGL